MAGEGRYLSVHCVTPLKLENVLKVADSLPPGARILAELRELLLDPNSETEAITGLLRRDSALTTRIIRIANGVAFRRGDLVGSLDEAVLRIGLQQVYGLLGIASASQILGTPLKVYPIPSKALRENALFAALLMEELAPKIGEDARLAYTAGLLSSIGKIALDRTVQVLSRPGSPPLPPIELTGIIAWERDVFGLTSTEVAAHILRAWRFPAEVYVAIRDHRLEDLTVDPMPMAKLLHVAAAAVADHGHGLPGEHAIWERHAATAREDLALSDDVMAAGLDRAGAKFEKQKSAFD